jgi:hypothetical protein
VSEDRVPDVAAELAEVRAALREFAGQRRTRQALGLLGPNLSMELIDRLEEVLGHAAELLEELHPVG